jgi:diadenosine tetraphosphate (Ap4A) HIT family hydrolase
LYAALLESCPFCTLSPDRIVSESEHAIAFSDGDPVAPGHTLVIPRRHVASIFDLPPEEWAAVWNLVAHIRSAVLQALHPDAFNIGINDGIAAGQTVMHAHVHLIPRWIGDVPDPRGGVRWVIPAKAAYWRER